MTKYLQTTYSIPLEREFEGWIVAGMERYLKRLGLDYAIWAVGPAKEVAWPADEYLLTNSKMVGLQFKQAKLAKGPVTASRLKWTLHQPPRQFELVQRFPEIFYCLPTFINRELREEALQHCIFWRPSEKVDKNVWYNNPKGGTPYKCEKHSMRWGLFVEGLLDCSLGKPIQDQETGLEFVKEITLAIKNLIPTENNASSEMVRVPSDMRVYLLVLKI